MHTSTSLRTHLKLPRIGPGALVAAAFIGPGTVTTCAMAGIRFGYALLWALLFATIGTIILQEMAARLGVVGNIGLGAAIRRRMGASWMQAGAALLVASAIVVGNAAYQTGNVLGAALGIEIMGGSNVRFWALVTAMLALALLLTGKYRVIEGALVGAVIVMSMAFLITAGWLTTDPGAMLSALLSPQMPEGGAIMALGLVGTTIVPYNLFLHADAARERFGVKDPADGESGSTAGRRAVSLRDARVDLVVAVSLGGLVSMAIVVAAAAGSYSGGGAPPTSAVELARGLTPLLGPSATIVFAVGLFAAGLTSAITAPLAAAYAMAGAMGWNSNLRDPRLRATLTLVIVAGAAFAVAGVRPLPAILFAQAANGLLLPLVALFLLWVMNDRQLLGHNTNGWVANLAGALVVLLTAVLGTRALMSAIGG